MTIYERLVQVMDKISRMDKDGTNDAQRYEYLSEEKITTTLHPVFAEAGLTFRPKSMSILSEFDYPTRNSTAHAIRILCTYELADIEGNTLEVQVVSLIRRLKKQYGNPKT